MNEFFKKLITSSWVMKSNIRIQYLVYKNKYIANEHYFDEKRIKSLLIKELIKNIENNNLLTILKEEKNDEIKFKFDFYMFDHSSFKEVLEAYIKMIPLKKILEIKENE